MSQKTKQGLRQTNNSNFPNNNSAFITPEKLRDFNSDIIDSVALDVDSQLSGSVDITGSLLVSTNITASGHISASTYYGDGSNLTGVTAQPPAGTISGSSQVILTDTTGNLGGNRITGSVSSAVSSSYAVSASRVQVDNQPNFNKEHYLTWVDNTDYDGIKIDATNLKYNSSTNILDSVYFRGDLIGNADTATSSQTSISSSFSQTSISASHAEVADFAISASFTNAQTLNVNTKGDNREYSLLFATSSGEQPIYIDQQKNILYNPSGNRLTVSHFQGQLTGNADTATTASYAVTASHALNGGVTSIIAGANISIDQSQGDVTISTTQHTETGSLLVTASNDFSQITFTKGDASTFELDVTPRRVIETVKNKNGFMAKGTPVYVSGSTGNELHVYAADAGLSNRVPATFILDQDLDPDESGFGILSGFINGVDTSLFAEGANIYLAVGGGYTDVQPTGSAFVQKLGNVVKSALNGSGVISGAGRVNALPNLTSGYAWVGDVNGVPQAVATSSFAVSIDTGSLATTGSNTFIGNQIITGSLTVNDSSATAFTVTSGPGDTSPVIIEGGPNFVDKFTPSKLSGLSALDLGQTGYVTASHLRNDNVYLGEQGNNININTVEASGGVYIGSNPSSGNPVTLANNLIVGETQLFTHVNQVRMAGSGSTLNSNPTAVEIIGNVTSSINKSNLIVNPQTITDTLTVGPDNNAFVVGPVTVSGTITLEGDSELSIYSTPTNDAFITGAAAVGNDFVFTRNDGTQFNVGVPGADVSYLATTGSNTFNGNQTLSYTNTDKRGLIFPTQDTSANPAEFFFGRRADGRLALSGSGNWGSNDGIIVISPDNGWIEIGTTFNSNANTNLRGFTEVRGLSQQATYTASLERVELNTVMKLSQQDPLPGGSVGELAVSGSNLYFHNGTSWSQIN